uniref:Collagen alpha-6(VI) chain isoform X2 n=1 Tax=Geotrypetes seraphini TaxID=260995 RepID=A0A6P8PUX1_GEOSA|nr:collagen alpha-6(VI) chain isoform X2 [Geotrypetes seraphini]XP_033785926.1 collagen alpha-6(VI) chain isoform X2 [Geotrypetes seraphini]
MDIWKAFLFVLCAVTWCSTDSQTTVCRNATVADIVFLVDSSSSTEEQDFELVKSFLYTVVASLNIGRDAVQVGVAQFSTKSSQKFLLNQYSRKNEILEEIEKLTYNEGDTYAGSALDFVRTTYFTELAGSRAKKNVLQVVIFITDGKSEDEVEEPARQLKAMGISVYTIGIGFYSIDELHKIASKPIEKFVFTLEDFSDLKDISSLLLETVCSSVETQIQAYTRRYADIVFLVDTSTNMGASAFQQVKNFLSKIIQQLDIGIDKYRIGLAKYSATLTTEFLLDTYHTKEQVLNHIRKHFKSEGGSLMTGNALKQLHLTFFSADARGSRLTQGTPQFAVVITSGKSEDSVKRVARELKTTGVTAIAVGVQKSDKNELDIIATPPFAFQLMGPQSINQRSKEILEVFQAPIQQQFAIPAKPPAVCSSASVADIVFLIDESSSIGVNNFQLTRIFLHKVISALDIGKRKVRVGLVLYSDESRLEFALNAFYEKYEILDYITKLPYRGGRANTGAAINFLRQKVFTRKRGSRARNGVQQIAVVLTNGQSMDDFALPAAKLRRAGVEVFAVGFQNATKNELKMIASHPSRKHVSNVESFLQLSNLELKIKKRLCHEILANAFVEPIMLRTLELGCVNTEEADIYFLIDGSGSIYPEDFLDMKAFMDEMIKVFQIGANKVRFGVVQYSNRPQIEFTIGEYNTEKNVRLAIKRIDQLGGGTNTGEALRSMKILFAKAASDRTSTVPQSLVVITDGESQDQVAEPAAELREEGITIYAIGIKNAVEKELKEIAGSEDKMFFVDNFDSLKLIKNELVRDICSPEACKNMKADIMFLVDSSGSIHPDDFEKMKQFMDLLIKKTDIGANSVQIGVIQFSSQPQEEFPLNRYHRKADIHNAIDNIRQMQEGTLTGEALRFASSYFDPAKGGRPNTQQYLIVITDGEAQDEVAQPAQALRNKGITTFAIGILQANYTQLVEIAGLKEKVFFEETFDSLSFLDNELLFEICNPTDPCKRTEEADIIFLVDGSISINPEQFLIMQRFMEAVVNDSVVGRDNVQFGAVVYSTRAEQQFLLNNYSTKAEVRQAIFNLKRVKGLTYTATALIYTQQRFGPDYGGRPNVTKILVLITDGATSRDDKPKLPSAAQSLRKEGVIVYAVGVGEANKEELKLIAGQPDRCFFVQNYTGLENLQQNITSNICNESKPVCAHDRVDIVFLIDGSESIRADYFNTMKTFMKVIVESFSIAANKIQIGVAQFSAEPQKEFYLNEFNSNTVIQNHIDKIVQLKSGTYTGKALNFVKSFFEPDRGSRKNQGVPQYLLVITDGESSDLVEEAAAALRNEKINIIAIGIGLPNSFELIQIAGKPENVYTVTNFETLESIKRQIVTEICEPDGEPDLPRDCTIDISVAVDISERIKIMSPQRLEQQMHTHLSEVLLRMSRLSVICCASGLQAKIRFKYLAVARDGNILFESDFENYSEEILRKYIAVQSTADTSLDVNFLESIWKKANPLPSATEKKIMLIFTDGLDESTERLKKSSESLRMQGLHALLLVGLEGVHKFRELQEIEFGRGFGYMQPLSIKMQDLPSILLRDLDTIVERECCNVVCKCLGQEGSRGSQGVRGPQGKVGFRGPPGHPGEEGGIGERGPHGLNGTQGEQGCSGARGPKGTRGFRGAKGDDGENGIDGVNGEQGAYGLPGASGEKGHTGNQGRKGPRGQPGERGEAGFRGDSGDPGTDNNARGPVGDQGKPGRQGETGIDGGRGSPGEKGTNGRQGHRGTPGLKGARGIPGEPGNKGARGIQGIQGPTGLQGPKGQIGQQGLPGPQGNPGNLGVSGSAGSPGPNGQKGEPGEPGMKGDVGSRGGRGLPGFDGSNGYGLPGKKGSKGQLGLTGYAGAQGDDGDSGSSGEEGPKGIRGRRGSGGFSGPPGDPGVNGPKGPRGQKGASGITALTPCELIKFTRENCPCLSAASNCPVYPTELVFAIDTSQDVTSAAFDRMKGIVVSFLEKLEISENNCPNGARVAIVTYSDSTEYYIRFSDFRKKKLLIEAVQNLSYKRSGRRNIGNAMRFVARHVFKRVRQGILTRKVAMFLSGGPSQDTVSINTAVLEFNALEIIPVVISFSEEANIRNAFETDDTRRAHVFIWRTVEDQRLEFILSCTLCYDKCFPDEECELAIPPPVELDMDIAFVLDSSYNVRSEDYEVMKGFVSAMLDQFVVSSDPLLSNVDARVALVQQTPPGFVPNTNIKPAKLEFNLDTFSSKSLMQSYIEQSVHQLHGSTAIGYAVQWTIDNIFSIAPRPRKHKVLFTILGSKTAHWDRAMLNEVSRSAKCQGFTMVTLAFGNEISYTDMVELSSSPRDQHLLHLFRTLKPEMTYAQRFSRAFLNLLKSGINAYPPPEISCGGRGDTRSGPLFALGRVSTVEFSIAVNSKERNTSESVREENEKVPGRATQLDADTTAKSYGAERPSEEIAKERTEDTTTQNNTCMMDQDAGSCEKFTLKWYYNKLKNACIPFWYGGCDGNSNRFETQEACETLCIGTS